MVKSVQVWEGDGVEPISDVGWTFLVTGALEIMDPVPYGSASKGGEREYLVEVNLQQDAEQQVIGINHQMNIHGSEHVVGTLIQFAELSIIVAGQLDRAFSSGDQINLVFRNDPPIYSVRQ